MNIIIAAGGTGGHVFPAISVAQEIRKQNPSAQITFVGTKKGFEASLVPSYGFPIEFVEIGGLHSKSFFTKFRNLLLLPKAFWVSQKLLSKYSPEAVFGIGGYVSGPLLLMASTKNIRTGILEPNATAGVTNRFLGKFVSKVFLAFDHAKIFFPKSKCIYSGNPIRADILKIKKPDFSHNKKTIFIFGGSQGAGKINQSVIDMIEKNPAYWKQYSFIHQTGLKDYEKVLAVYQKFQIEADVRKFFDDMAQAYERSHFIIARSGSSVLEIAAIGRPSLLIPYPYAADNHQMQNAKVLADHHAALLLEDSQCSGGTMSDMIKPVLQSNQKLQDMSEFALQFRMAHSAATIASELTK